MYSQDHPKYKKVQEKLKAYKFAYSHLNPDSVELVDKLLTQYEKMFKKFQQLKKNKPKTQPNVADLQHRFDLINERYYELKKQNQLLKNNKKQGDIEERIKTLNNALNTCRIGYEQKVDELEERLKTSDRIVQDLKADKKSLGDENERIKKMLVSNEEQKDSSAVELSKLLEKKKKSIQKLEEENTKYRYEIDRLQQMYEHEKQNKNENENEKVRKNNTLIQVLREQISELQSRVSKGNKVVQNERRENKELKESISKLREEVGRLRNEEDYVKSEFTLQNNEKSKLEQMYKQTKRQLQNMIEERDKYKGLREQDSRQMQRLNMKIKQVINKNNNYKSNENKLGEELTVLNNNFIMKVKELRENENVRICLEGKIKELQYKLIQKQQKSESRNVSISLQQEHKNKINIYEKEIQIKKNELKVMHENEHKILMQKTYAQSELKKLQNIIGQGNKQIEIMQNQKQVLMRENRELKNIVENRQVQGYSKNTQIYRNKQTIQTHEIMIQELRVAIKTQQNNNKVYNSQILEMEKLLANQKESNKQMHQDNKQMKLMVQSLTKTKDELFKKYKNVSDEKTIVDNKKLQQINDYHELQAEAKKISAQLQQKNMSLLTLNTEYDELQNVLDDKTVQNQQLKYRMCQMEKQLHKYGKGLGEREVNMQGMSNQIKSLENSLQKMERQNKRACEQLNDCHNEMIHKNGQINTLKNDLKVVVLNNKEVQKQAQKYKLLVKESDKKIKERIQELDEQRQIASSFKIQNENIMEELQKYKKQIQRLQNWVNEASEENNKMYNTITQRDMEYQQINIAYHQLQSKENDYLHQIQYYERQLRQIGDDMQRKDQQIRRLAQDRDIYRAQVTTSRRSNNTEVKYHHLQEKAQCLQNDYELKKRQCQSLRTELREYQRVIEEQRQRSFYLEQRMEQKNSQFSHTPIKRFTKSRVESENWNGYNRDPSEIEHSIDMKQSNHINISESFESQVSIESKVIDQKLKKINNQYQATMVFNERQKR